MDKLDQIGLAFRTTKGEIVVYLDYVHPPFFSLTNHWDGFAA